MKLTKKFIPLTGIFWNPELGDVVLLTELEESDSTETCHKEAEGNVGKRM